MEKRPQRTSNVQVVEQINRDDPLPALDWNTTLGMLFSSALAKP